MPAPVLSHNKNGKRSRTRLHSDSISRPDDANEKERPKRIVFLSVEGNITDGDYFTCIRDMRHQLGIKSIVLVEVLTRAENDTDSSPEAVLELMEEYLTLRFKSDDFLSRLYMQISRYDMESKYPEEFIRHYFQSDESLDPLLVEEFELFCRRIKICVDYNRYLYNIRNGAEESDDIFGIVIDRDWNTHTVKAMKEIIQASEAEGVKCFVTNPCIEFWLLLHLVDVKEQYRDNLQDFTNNVKTNHKTYTERQLSQAKKRVLGIPATQSIPLENGKKAKNITIKDFEKYYLPNTDTAIQRIEKDFSTNLNELIGNEETDESRKGILGSNLPELFRILREI